MTENEHSENATAAPLNEEDLRRRLAEIDGTLLAGIETDARLQNSIPETQHNADLDFIQMSGLTRPTEAQSYEEPPAAILEAARTKSELDPNRPLSFYEPGVVDVDEAFAGAEDERTHRSEPQTPERPRSADALRQIIADLEKPSANHAPLPAPEPETEAEEIIPADADLSAGEPVPAEIEPNEIPQAEAAPEPSLEEPDAQAPIEQAVLPAISDAEPSAPAAEDDFDLLIQSSSIAEQLDSSIHYPEPEKTAPPSSAPDPGLSQRLAEAEQLLQELEQQPRDESPKPPPSPSAAPPVPREIRWQRPPVVPPEDPEGKEPHDRELRFEYDYSAAPGRRSRRQRAHIRRRFTRLVFLVLCAAVIGAAGFLVYNHVLHPAIAPPDEMLANARQLMEHKDYEAASSAYQHFTRRYSDHPALPEAEFEAALALKLAPGVSRDAVRSLREESLALFKKFVEDNPGNPKRARAECIMGILYFELGDYKNAIGLLREPARQIDDPDAVLPILRTLAWSYRMDGSYDDAESAYLQAAALPRNYSVDADYYELGDMYRKRADAAATPEERRLFEQRTAEYWSKAVRVPQIDPGTRDTIQKQLDRLQAEFGGAETGMPPVLEPGLVAPDKTAGDDTAAADSAAVVANGGDPSPDQNVPVVSEGEAIPAEKPKEWEPDPAVEAQQPPASPANGQ